MKIPEGWQLVPKEPTDAMCHAYRDFIKRGEYFRDISIYKAMIAAAPNHPDEVDDSSR